EEDADVEFVFLALEGGEEAADARKFVVAFFDETLLIVGQVVPGDVGGDVGGFGGADHLAVVGAVFCGGPGGDGAVGEGLRCLGWGVGGGGWRVEVAGVGGGGGEREEEWRGWCREWGGGGGLRVGFFFVFLTVGCGWLREVFAPRRASPKREDRS